MAGRETLTDNMLEGSGYHLYGHLGNTVQGIVTLYYDVVIMIHDISIGQPAQRNLRNQETIGQNGIQLRDSLGNFIR